MPSTLPRVMDLFKGTWDAFVKTWDITVRYSAWFIPATILQVLPLFVPGDQGSIRLFSIIGPLAALVVMLWASVSLYLAVLTLEKGEKVTDKTTAAAWSLIPSMILIGIFQGIATLGALVLLIIPGIYVGVRLGFSQLSFLNKGLKGRAALAASWELTKNRFWPIFGRQLAGGLVFVIITAVIMGVAMSIVELVAGAKLNAALSNPDDPIGAGIASLVSSIVQAALLPAVVLFEVKLYRALEKTR